MDPLTKIVFHTGLKADHTPRMVPAELKHRVNEAKKMSAYTDWEKQRSLSSLYDMVPLVCVDRKISRAYFKFAEIEREYELLGFQEADSIYTIHVCEGPGGFVQAACEIAERRNITHDFHAISKYSKQERNLHFSEKIDRRKISYADIMHVGEINKFARNLKKADLITADGAFFVREYQNQEIETVELLKYEVLLAMKMLKENGSFVIKFFDIFEPETVQILEILCEFFENVDVFKPKLSRPSNSEKYLVCKGYRSSGGCTSSSKALSIITKCNDLSVKQIQSIHDTVSQRVSYTEMQQINAANKYLSDLEIQ